MVWIFKFYYSLFHLLCEKEVFTCMRSLSETSSSESSPLEIFPSRCFRTNITKLNCLAFDVNYLNFVEHFCVKSALVQQNTYIKLNVITFSRCLLGFYVIFCSRIAQCKFQQPFSSKGISHLNMRRKIFSA